MEARSASSSNCPDCPLCSSDQTDVARHLEHLISDHFELVSMAIKRMEQVYEMKAVVEDPHQLSNLNTSQHEEKTLKRRADEESKAVCKSTKVTSEVSAESVPKVSVDKGGFYVVTIGNKKSVVVPTKQDRARSSQQLTQGTEKGTSCKVETVAKKECIESITDKKDNDDKEQVSSSQLKNEDVISSTSSNLYKAVDSSKCANDPNYSARLRYDTPSQNESLLSSAKVPHLISKISPNSGEKNVKNPLPSPEVSKVDLDIKITEGIELNFGKMGILPLADYVCHELLLLIESSVSMNDKAKCFSLNLEPCYLEPLEKCCRSFGDVMPMMFSETFQQALKLRVIENAQLHLSFLKYYTPIVMKAEKHHPLAVVRSLCASLLNESSPQFTELMSLLKAAVIHCFITHQDVFISLILRDHTKEQARDVLTALVKFDFTFLEPTHNDFLFLALSIILQRDIYVYTIIRDPETLLPGQITDIELVHHYENEHSSLVNHVIFSAPRGLQKAAYNLRGPCCVLHKHAGNKYFSILKKAESVMVFKPFAKPFPW